MKSSICVTNIRVANRKQTASFRIAGLMLAIAPLWLMLATANTPAQAQASNATPNAAVTSSPGDWTQLLRDNMQRWNPYETVLGVNNVSDLKLKWQNPLGGAEPVVANGTVYSSCASGICALNASTGAKLWSYAIGGGDVTGSPAVENRVVYFGSEAPCHTTACSPAGGTVYALNASTGAELWSYATGVPVATSPAVANGVVYVGSNDDERGENDFFALNASTGALLWSTEGVGPPTSFSPPAVADGVVYVAAADALDRSYDVYAANASTGALLWSFQKAGSPYADEGPFGAPAVANGVVYIGSEGTTVPVPDFVPIPGNLYALNASTGAELWSYKTGNIGGAPAVANGIVYAGSDNGVYALNASTGALLWGRTSQNGADSPAVANGVVYFGSGDGSVYALNASTGAELWSYDAGGASTPIIVDGVIYFPGVDGLYAFSVGAVSPGADLVLRLQPSLTTVEQGDVLTYTFPVWNLGSDDAVHEVLMTQVPYGTTFDYIRISGTPGLGTCTTPAYGATGGPIVCHENSSMAPNTTWTVRLTVKVTAPSGAVITQNGTVTEDTFDPNLANNTAEVSATVEPAQSADLFLRIQPAPTTVAQGDLITYAFPVWNLGPDDAVNEVLNTQVPAGTTFDYIRISGTPGLGTCTTPPYEGTGQIVCHENGSMAPNSTWTVRLTVKVTAPSGTVITENAATMADTRDPNLANNTATVSTTVQ